MTKIAINVTETGTGTVFLDGKDISKSVSKVTVSVLACESARVTLELIGDISIEADDAIITTGVVDGRIDRVRI